MRGWAPELVEKGGPVGLSLCELRPHPSSHLCSGDLELPGSVNALPPWGRCSGSTLETP